MTALFAMSSSEATPTSENGCCKCVKLVEEHEAVGGTSRSIFAEPTSTAQSFSHPER